MAALAPSGEQFEIALGDQRAVVVEVGGGLRDLLGGGPRHPRRLRRREICPSGRGPGPEPLAQPRAGRKLRVRRAAASASARRARERQRDPRARALVGLDRRGARAASRRRGAHAPSPAGLSVRAGAQHRVLALARGAAGAQHGHERRGGALPLRNRSASLPDRRNGARRLGDAALSGAHRAAARTSAASRRGRARRRYRVRLPAGAADRRHAARQLLHRSRARRGRARACGAATRRRA